MLILSFEIEKEKIRLTEIQDFLKFMMLGITGGGGGFSSMCVCMCIYIKSSL